MSLHLILPCTLDSWNESSRFVTLNWSKGIQDAFVDQKRSFPTGVDLGGGNKSVSSRPALVQSMWHGPEGGNGVLSRAWCILRYWSGQCSPSYWWQLASSCSCCRGGKGVWYHDSKILVSFLGISDIFLPDRRWFYQSTWGFWIVLYAYVFLLSLLLEVHAHKHHHAQTGQSLDLMLPTYMPNHHFI